MKKLINKTSRGGILFAIISLLSFSLLVGCQERPESDKKEKEYVNENNNDMGKKPWVLDIEKATIENDNYREAVWTGEYMQMVFMSLKPGEIIDLEVHHNHDQFFRLEQGEARIIMGKTEDELTFEEVVYDDWAIFVPAGYWHKVENVGDTDLKVYTIYGPPEHPAGIIHKTLEDTEDYHE